MFLADPRVRATFLADPRVRATWRWGGAIAVLLMVQSVVLSGLFWLLASNSHRHTAEEAFRADCRTVGALHDAERHAALRRMIAEDIHRDRFLALFDRNGRLLDGNVAAIPPGVVVGRSSTVATVSPTQLPGKTRDVARLAVCAMPDGDRLLTGVDLDEAEEALRVVERSLIIGLGLGLLLALGVGLIAGRRAARQVDSVRQLTEAIVAGDLDVRLAVGARPDSFELLCAHINTMLDRLQVLVSDVRVIGDDIAHQLRTPLTRLRARLERGLRDAADRAAFEQVAEAALAEIDTLLGIVAALLRVRELEDHARRSRFATIDLAQLVADACELHTPTAEDRGIVLHCDIEHAPAVEGDASLLIEAVSNLIDNAMKFGPPGGTVRVALQAEGDAAVITVADDGDGVAPAERSLVTQRFYRGRHDCAGAGLGLSLVKAIADLHGFALAFADQGSAVSLVCRPAARLN
ncbi:sensor histidine kinase [Sphingomonas sp. PAMC 26605]|uniref:sensor histidine kinase n=1 Tax=Sphingomonas sp. PAMC 26605 TaxID=1112214 RepID=UPI00026CCA8F|nr:HAMP domain-containing sensor histidine kinase [Sphingomonas sp. PAMC 26605]